MPLANALGVMTVADMTVTAFPQIRTDERTHCHSVTVALPAADEICRRCTMVKAGGVNGPGRLLYRKTEVILFCSDHRPQYKTSQDPHEATRTPHTPSRVENCHQWAVLTSALSSSEDIRCQLRIFPTSFKKLWRGDGRIKWHPPATTVHRDLLPISLACVAQNTVNGVTIQLWREIKQL